MHITCLCHNTYSSIGALDNLRQWVIHWCDVSQVQAHDCGKYIKCESSQMDSNGNELFSRQGRTMANRKLMVLFPPENLVRPLPPIAFGLDEPSKIIRMQFMANPAPANNQAIWHINPSRQVELIHEVRSNH